MNRAGHGRLEMATVALKTLGCKVNQAESEAILAELISHGLDPVRFDETADVYVLNSCTVTAEADHKSRRLARAARRRNPGALVILAGCYATEAGHRSVGFDDGIVLLGNERKDAIAALVADRIGIEPAARMDGSAQASRPAARTPGARTRAMVKVQDGCDNYCAYCVVPFARGAPKSRPAARIIDEIERLSSSGVAEVVLTGVNMGRYSSDGLDLAGLIRRVLETKIGRIRLSSVEPQDISSALIELIGTESRICSHLHVPLQSGSDAVLARMGRRYDAAGYLELARDLAAARPGLALSTDVIVGFPSETDGDVDATMSLLERIEPMKLHVFKYSPRPRTRATTFADQIDGPTKTSRSRRLAELDAALGERFAQRLLGQTFEVLVERVSAGRAQGVAGNYVRCFFKGDASLRGNVVRMKATRRRGRALAGTRIDDQ